MAKPMTSKALKAVKAMKAMQAMKAMKARKAMKTMKAMKAMYSIEHCAVEALKYLQVMVRPGLAYPVISELRVIAKLAKRGLLRGELTM